MTTEAVDQDTTDEFVTIRLRYAGGRQRDKVLPVYLLDLPGYIDGDGVPFRATDDFAIDGELHRRIFREVEPKEHATVMHEFFLEGHGDTFEETATDDGASYSLTAGRAACVLKVKRP